MSIIENSTELMGSEKAHKNEKDLIFRINENDQINVCSEKWSLPTYLILKLLIGKEQSF